MKKFPLLLLVLLIAITFFVAGCEEDEDDDGYEKVLFQEGEASWYGEGFHGKKTANGEIFNMHAYTAAHKDLPFNTKILVVNKKNNKSVVVRINDRGPYVGNRIIDLSYAAAKELDMVDDGTTKVKLYKITETTTSSGEQYFIQIGSFSKKKNANQLRDRASKYTNKVHIKQEGGKFKVMVGPFPSEAAAQKVLKQLKKKAKINGFITQ